MTFAMALMLWGQTAAYPTYAVAPLNGVTIAGLPAVTSRIAVDQFGYSPEGTKVAVINDPLKGFDAGEGGDRYVPGERLQVRRREDGKPVFAGAPTVWNGGKVHEDSGDRGWWFDFSALKSPGEYYVYDLGTRRRSPVFKIGEAVFRPTLRAASRMFYYQRIGVPIEAKYAEGPWTDGPAYSQDAKTRSLEAKDDRSKDRDLSGGWMDAGDTDKYPSFLGEVIHPLLYAYRANPKAFRDDNNIPESGNGLPDLLDEVKFELEWLGRMQFEDGALPTKMGQIDYNGKYPLSQDARPRYYGPKDSGCTIYACAAYAHAARVYGGFSAWKPFAKEMQDRAVKAWGWYKSHPRTYKLDTGEIKSGLANRSAEEQDRMEAYAAIHLFALTHDEAYAKAIREKAGSARQLTEGLWSPYEAGASEALVDYTTIPDADPAIVAKVREALKRSAASDHFAPAPEADLFRAWMEPTNYHWGSNIVRSAWGVAAVLAAKSADAPTAARLRARAADMLHSFHGVNPLGAVYLTNMGRYGAESSLHEMYHERYGASSAFAKNPPPGYVVGGPNQQFSGKAADGAPSVEWVKSQPRAKAYMDTGRGWPESSWELSEPAIYYQAMYVRLVAEFAR